MRLVWAMHMCMRTYMHAHRYAKGEYHEFGLGEQNLLNAWLIEHPGSVMPLPCRWNRRIDRSCYERLPGIRHANRMLASPRDWEQTDQRLDRLLVDRKLLVEHMLEQASPTSADGATPLYLRQPLGLCNAALRPEWRGNVSECVYLVTKRWARDDVVPWHESYHKLSCAAGKKNFTSLKNRIQQLRGGGGAATGIV